MGSGASKVRYAGRLYFRTTAFVLFIAALLRTTPCEPSRTGPFSINSGDLMTQGSNCCTGLGTKASDTTDTECVQQHTAPDAPKAAFGNEQRNIASFVNVPGHNLSPETPLSGGAATSVEQDNPGQSEIANLAALPPNIGVTSDPACERIVRRPNPQPFKADSVAGLPTVTGQRLARSIADEPLAPQTPGVWLGWSHVCASTLHVILTPLNAVWCRNPIQSLLKWRLQVTDRVQVVTSYVQVFWIPVSQVQRGLLWKISHC